MSEHEKHSVAEAVEFLVVAVGLAVAFATVGAFLGGVLGFSVMLPSKPVHLPPPGDVPIYVAMGGGLFGAYLGAAIGAAVGLIVGLWREGTRTRGRGRKG